MFVKGFLIRPVIFSVAMLRFVTAHATSPCAVVLLIFF